MPPPQSDTFQGLTGANPSAPLILDLITRYSAAVRLGHALQRRSDPFTRGERRQSLASPIEKPRSDCPGLCVAVLALAAGLLVAIGAAACHRTDWLRGPSVAAATVGLQNGLCANPRGRTTPILLTILQVASLVRQFGSPRQLPATLRTVSRETVVLPRTVTRRFGDKPLQHPG